MQDGRYAVNTQGERVDSAKSAKVHHERAMLKHYVCKSREEYEAKMQRGSAMGNHKSHHYFDYINR